MDAVGLVLGQFPATQEIKCFVPAVRRLYEQMAGDTFLPLPHPERQMSPIRRARKVISHTWDSSMTFGEEEELQLWHFCRGSRTEDEFQFDLVFSGNINNFEFIVETDHFKQCLWLTTSLFLNECVDISGKKIPVSQQKWDKEINNDINNDISLINLFWCHFMLVRFCSFNEYNSIIVSVILFFFI